MNKYIANAKGESLYTSVVQVLSFHLNPSWTEVILASRQLVGKEKNAKAQTLVKLL